MKRRTIVGGTVGLVAAAFATATFFYPQTQEQPAVVAQSDVLVRPHSPIIGPENAPVTIVEFFDPSCEACRAFYPIVKQILEAFPSQTRLVIRYAPLHQGSDEAVKILEASRLQNKFESVLEALLAQQPNWAIHGAPNIELAWTIAGEAGLDLDKARLDTQAPSVVAVLNQDVADMRAVGLTGTPTFFVNGKPLPSFGPQQLYDLVASEVARSL